MRKNQSFFGLFFTIIIFSIPIFNQLHFSLIDHCEAIDKQNKEVIHHNCQHFTFYTVFLDTHDDLKIEVVEKIQFVNEINSKLVEKQSISAIELYFNRGPPNKENREFCNYFTNLSA